MPGTKKAVRLGFRVKRRSRLLAPPLFIVFTCPECYNTMTLDVYADGPPLCFGLCNINNPESPNGHKQTPMQAERIA